MKGSLVCLDTQRTNRCTKVSTFVRTGKGKHSTGIDRQGRCVVVRQAGTQAGRQHLRGVHRLLLAEGVDDLLKLQHVGDGWAGQAAE